MCSSFDPSYNYSGKTSVPSSDGNHKQTNSLSTDEMIEMMKNFAAVNEKLYKWQQSLKKLEAYPDHDPNKCMMNDIIRFVKKDKNSTKDKAIYLYGQLANTCHQQKNYIGAAKAYERAATLRFDAINVLNDNNLKDIKTTIEFLDSAIVNYDAIRKYRNAGTLHYRCSRILRLINAPPEQVTRHYCQALEYFTMRNTGLKHDRRLDGVKVSCYSSTINYRTCNGKCCQDISEQMSSKFNRYLNDCEYNGFPDRQDYFMSLSSRPTTEEYYDLDSSPMSGNGMQHKALKSSKMLRQKRCKESVQKLVKKLRKTYPFYEVSAGANTGRVYCKICDRHLGAVSSTLKNHVNTQEHKLAVEEGVNGKTTSADNNAGERSDKTVDSINSDKSSGALAVSDQTNCVQSIQSHHSFDFDALDIQWVPGFRSPTPTDFFMSTSADT